MKIFLKLLPNDLEIEAVRYHEDGTVKSAYVTNGSWYYESDGIHGYSKVSNEPVSRLNVVSNWNLKDYWTKHGEEQVVEIPIEESYFYDPTILEDKTQEDRFLEDKLSEEYYNDDIPF